MRYRPVVVVMLKQPQVGRTKTRLGREIGMVEAAWWFRHQSAQLLRRLRDPRWRLMLAVTPDRAVTAAVWPADLPRIAQGRGDLGHRMARALRGAGPGPVLVVGGDIPGLGRAQIAGALARLRQCDAVLGPAADGGFWLIGLRRTRVLPPRLFAGVRWSSPQTLADTEAGLSGLRIGHAARLRDVDTAADLLIAARTD